MMGFDNRNISMGSERSGLTFVCEIKPCRTPVQRYKVRIVTHSDYVVVFLCNFTLRYVSP